MKTTKKESTERNQFCEFCDWTEDGEGTNYRLNRLLKNGEKGVFCSFLHKVKRKKDGKYCTNFIGKEKEIE